MIILIQNIKNLEFNKKRKIIKLKKILDKYYDIPVSIMGVNKKNLLYLYEYYMKLKRKNIKKKKEAKKQTRIFLYSFFTIKNYINLENFNLYNFKILELCGIIIIVLTFKKTKQIYKKKLIK